MMDLNKLIDKRMHRIKIMVEVATKKIVKKEFGKFKKDIIKELKEKS